MEEQLSSPLSQVLNTYDFGNFENCEQILVLLRSILVSILSCTICVEIYTEGPPLASRNMYPWYILNATSFIVKKDLPRQREAN